MHVLWLDVGESRSLAGQRGDKLGCFILAMLANQRGFEDDRFGWGGFLLMLPRRYLCVIG